MKTGEKKRQYITRQFTRDYLFVSLLPVILVLVCAIVGARFAQHFVSDLLHRSNQELLDSARHQMEILGQQFVRNKARDVAQQVQFFLGVHAKLTEAEFQDHPGLRSIAMQKVGDTGYTCLYEAETGVMRIHPNPNLIGREMRFLAEKLPSWWAIFAPTLSGTEGSGYYDWLEKNGTIRRKFMTMTPVGKTFHGKTLMIAATTYIDEFSAPMTVLKKQTDIIAARYESFISRQGILFGGLSAAALLLTFSAVYLLGRRSGLRYIRPIEQLAGAAKQLSEGRWESDAHTALLQRKDEIGDLADAFDHMQGRLRELFTDLEDRVNELNRTQAALQENEAHYRNLFEKSRKAEELYRSLIHSSADAIVVYDMQGNATYISPSFTQIFGWSEKELAGKRIPFLPDSESDATMAIIRGLIENGTPCRGFETKRYTKDGRLKEVSISASRYEDHKGRPAGMLVILRDISEKKQMEAQLRHAQRMESIGTLAGGIAHDFNNLMMGIQGNISLLLHETDRSHPFHAKLKNIENNIESGARLTGQLLGYARKGKYRVSQIDLNQIVSESAETFGRTRKEISVRCKTARDLFPIEADASQLKQILLNLFVNAADAMPKGGELTATTMNVHSSELTGKPYTPGEGHYVQLQVADTGQGMDRKTLDRIFDPFFTTKSIGRGTGLGLASAYGVVKAHGGYIDAESEEGRGTTFTIYLPATPGQSEGATQGTRNGSFGMEKGKGTVLLVDDEEIVLDVGVQMIEKLGFSVLFASDGEQALSIYGTGSQTIDLVILDMIMPKMNGGDLFDRIKAINPEARVLLSSGYSIDGQAEEILHRGCNGFIQKPFNMERLSEKIESVLNE